MAILVRLPPRRAALRLRGGGRRSCLKPRRLRPQGEGARTVEDKASAGGQNITPPVAQAHGRSPAQTNGTKRPLSPERRGTSNTAAAESRSPRDYHAHDSRTRTRVPLRRRRRVQHQPQRRLLHERRHAGAVTLRTSTANEQPRDAALWNHTRLPGTRRRHQGVTADSSRRAGRSSTLRGLASVGAVAQPRVHLSRGGSAEPPVHKAEHLRVKLRRVPERPGSIEQPLQPLAQCDQPRTPPCSQRVGRRLLLEQHQGDTPRWLPRCPDGVVVVRRSVRCGAATRWRSRVGRRVRVCELTAARHQLLVERAGDAGDDRCAPVEKASCGGVRVWHLERGPQRDSCVAGCSFGQRDLRAGALACVLSQTQGQPNRIGRRPMPGLARAVARAVPKAHLPAMSALLESGGGVRPQRSGQQPLERRFARDVHVQPQRPAHRQRWDRRCVDRRRGQPRPAPAESEAEQHDEVEQHGGVTRGSVRRCRPPCRSSHCGR
eukprot:476173-Prymnesium_polylepis.2